MRLIFVRHAEPNYEKDCITENGVLQAKSTAKRLSDEDIKAVFASPMGRAVETASYIAKDHGLEVQTLPFMHEINWGDIDENVPEDKKIPYDGHPWTIGHLYLSEDKDNVASPKWRDHHFFKDNKLITYYDLISKEFDKFLENYGIVRKNNLYFCEKECNDTVLLVAHGGSGSVMFSHVLSLPLPFVLTSMPYGVCSVSILEFSPANDGVIVPRLELFNDMRHLDKVKVEALHFEK